MVRKAGGDELVILAMNDPVMAAAIHGARKLAEIPHLAKNPAPRWVASRSRSPSPQPMVRSFSGFILRACRRPIHRANQQQLRSVVNLKMGDTVSFVKNEIVDWMYMDAGWMRGNYSAHAILKSARPEDREAFKRRFGLDYL
jgi:hypothetical protein